VSTADVVCSALLYRVIGALIKSDKLLLNYFLIGGVANACEEFLRGFFRVLDEICSFYNPRRIFLLTDSSSVPFSLISYRWVLYP
jgi:hypothetical protein